AALARLDQGPLRRHDAGTGRVGQRTEPAARCGARPLRQRAIDADRPAQRRRTAAARRRSARGKSAPAAPSLQRDRSQYRAGRAVSRGARWTRGDRLRCAWRGRLAVALAAVPSRQFGKAERAAARRVGTRTGGRAWRLLGRRISAAIRVPAWQAVPAAGARSYLARPPHGAG